MLIRRDAGSTASTYLSPCGNNDALGQAVRRDAAACAVETDAMVGGWKTTS
jgi:hypothetical protein